MIVYPCNECIACMAGSSNTLRYVWKYILETFSSRDVDVNVNANVGIMWITSLFVRRLLLFTPDTYVGYVGFEKSTFGSTYPPVASQHYFKWVICLPSIVLSSYANAKLIFNCLNNFYHTHIFIHFLLYNNVLGNVLIFLFLLIV